MLSSISEKNEKKKLAVKWLSSWFELQMFRYVRYVATEPNCRKMTPAKFAHNAISIVKHIANDHRMIAAATVLRIVFLLIVGSIETARLWFGHNCCLVLVNIRRYVWRKWPRLRSARKFQNLPIPHQHWIYIYHLQTDECSTQHGHILASCERRWYWQRQISILIG